jgi:glycosyltransferase involved in cell wall biosynthesis
MTSAPGDICAHDAQTPWVTVIFPAYQEEEFLEKAVSDVDAGLRTIERAGDSTRTYEIVIVENGSKDRTRQVADELATRFASVRSLFINEPNYGLALRHGLLAANGEWVVNFDVDLYSMDFLQKAIARMESTGASVVVASKRGEGSNDTRHWTRKFVTGVFSTLLKVGFGLSVSDTHGMKAMRRADVVELAKICKTGTDLFDTELILRAERSGLRTTEIGVTITETRPARTPIAGRIFRSVKGLGHLWLAFRAEAKSR